MTVISETHEFLDALRDLCALPHPPSPCCSDTDCDIAALLDRLESTGSPLAWADLAAVLQDTHPDAPAADLAALRTAITFMPPAEVDELIRRLDEICDAFGIDGAR